MVDIALNDSDRHFLRQCPQTVMVNKASRPQKSDLDRLKRIDRLQKARLIRGILDPNTAAGQSVLFMRISLTDAGRVAIGLQPIKSVSP